MQPRFHIDPDPYDNADDPAFATTFFARYPPRRAAHPLQLTPEIHRDYRFPTFYADVTYGLGTFTCDYGAAERLVAQRLHPSLQPVRALCGRAIIGVACYDYRAVPGMAPYSEIAVAIPVVTRGWWSKVPLFPLLPPMASQAGRFVVDMPETSAENQIRGNLIWGLPKTTRRVDIDVTENHITAAAFDGSTAYIELQLPRVGKTRTITEQSWVYTRTGGAVARSRSVLHGNLRTALAGRLRNRSAHLSIGTTDAAAELNQLRISPVPFQIRTGVAVSTVFDLPDQYLTL